MVPWVVAALVGGSVATGRSRGGLSSRRVTWHGCEYLRSVRIRVEVVAIRDPSAMSSPVARECGVTVRRRTMSPGSSQNVVRRDMEAGHGPDCENSESVSERSVSDG